MKKQNLSFSARYALSVLVAGFAAALLVFPPAYADEGFGVDGREDVLKQASAMVETILESDENTRFGLGLPSEVDVAALSLGECIQAYEVADSSYAELPTHCWPIFYEGDVIASIVASYDNNGETLYRFSTDGASIMQEHYRENGLGALVLDGDGRIGDMLSPSDAMETGQSCESYFEGAKRSGDVDNLTRKEIEYSSQSEKTPIAIPCEEGESEELEGGLSYGEGNFSAENDSVALASYGPVNLGVPLIYQGNTPTCWVASSKCIGQYLTGINRSIDDIHRYVKGFSSYQGGDGNDAVTALNFFIYPGTRTAIKAEYKTAWMSDSELYRWLSNGIPVYARLEDTSTGDGHAVVVCGCNTLSSGAFVATIMNPGTGKYELMTKNYDGYLKLQYNGVGWPWRRGSVVMTGFQKPYGGSTWAYYRSDGFREVGWHYKTDAWYYFKPTGIMAQSEWVSYNGDWYYFNSSGEMLYSEWEEISGYWYYFKSSGAAVCSDWLSDGGYWYAFDSSCQMRTGWYLESGNWYYFRTAYETPSGGPKGTMLCGGTWTMDGKAYRFDSSGICLNP